MITIILIVATLAFLAWAIKEGTEIERESRRLDREWAALHKRMEENTRKWYGDETL